MTLGTPVLIQDLEIAIKEFLIKNNYKYFIGFDSIAFNRAIRELENTFISTQKDSATAIVIEFQNPSIQDFLINYLKDKDDLITSLIESSLFVNQFFNVFTADPNADVALSRFIKLSFEQEKAIINRIKETYSKLKKSSVLRVTQSNSDKFNWYKYSSFKYSFLKDIYIKLGERNTTVRDFVYEKFQESILIDEYEYIEQSAYVSLLKTLDLNKLTFNEEMILDKFLENVYNLYDLDLFSDFETIFPTTYRDTIDDDLFLTKINEVVDDEVSNVDDSDINELISKIESVESLYKITYTEEIEKLKEKQSQYDSYLESQIENYIEEQRESHETRGLSDEEQNEVINQIFNSLLDD